MSKTVDQFVNLHNHSMNSVLDGFSSVKEMLEVTSQIGQPALAITDHGNMHSIYELHQEAPKYGMKAIAGQEFYMTPSHLSRKDRVPGYFGPGGRDDVSGRGAYTHITILAENNVGLSNLFKLTTLANTEGFFQKPRIDMELLNEYSEGLIATTGCPSGEIQTKIRLGMLDEAFAHAAEMQDIFGRDNYFLELMDHGMRTDLERAVKAPLLDIANKLDIPLLASGDSHYASQQDCSAHEHLLAIQTRAVMSELPDSEGGKRFAFDGQSYYLKSAFEMQQIFNEEEFPGALSNTVLIAERVNTSIDFDDSLQPQVDLPEGMTNDSFLRQEAFAGLARRLPDKANDPEYIARLNYELGVLEHKRFTGYILFVSDFVRWAKFVASPPVPSGAGRGSAAGSLVCFCVDITDVDPIPYKLIFERFINPERNSFPDVDADFEDAGRQRVIDYVIEKYGRERTAQVVTFGKILAKSAIKDTIRIMERPYSLGDELSKLLPPAEAGHSISLGEVYDTNHDRYHEGEDFRSKVIQSGSQDVIEIAKQLEGRTRSTGVHAAALIVSSKPLVDVVPLMMRQADDVMVTQWDYPTCEAIGLVKVDFLGIRNLGVVRDALANIKRTRGIDIDEMAMRLGKKDDKKTYEMLARGDSLGVFQLDGGGMRDLLRRMRPTTFEDISALIALYRPGPMGVNAHNDYADRKNELKPVVPIHPELEEPLREILSDTYNLCIYQEQIMQTAQKLAGFSLGQADNLRRAMGKKKLSVLQAEYIPFSEGMHKNGYTAGATKAIWDVLVPFAEYGFNRSHSVSYGFLSYTTAYLKANYPAEFMAALLTSTADKTDMTALYLNECRRLGIKVFAPDVNESFEDYFPASENEIYFGLKAIRGLGTNSAEEIVKTRLEGGKFKSISDFVSRVPSGIANKRVLEGLTYGGGFDSMPNSRKSLIASFPAMIKALQKTRKAADKGMVSLFDDLEEEKLMFSVLDIGEYPKIEKLKLERHVLGLYVSDHPLSGLKIDPHANVKIMDLNSGEIPTIEGWGNKELVSISGIITSLEVKRSKKTGESFAMGIFEDATGSINFAMFSKVYAKFGENFARDGIYQLKGQHRRRDEEELQFIIDSVAPLDFGENGSLNVKIRLTDKQWLAGREKLLERLKPHHQDKGSMIQMSIMTSGKNGEILDFTLEGVTVKRSPTLVSSIRELFGMDSIGKWKQPDTPVEKPAED
jgi:DNA polymerase-3 subunit alpha